MTFHITIKNKPVNWDDQYTENVLNKLIQAQKNGKTAWIKDNLDVKHPGIIKKLLFKTLGKIKWVRQKFFHIDPIQSSKTLNELRDQIEKSNNANLIAIFNSAVQNAKDINQKIDVKTIGQHPFISQRTSGLDLVQHSGLENVGNSCFCAAPIQLIANIEIFRNAFDPITNPLTKRNGESEVEFEERQSWQKDINNFLKRILTGEKNIDIQPIRKKIAQKLNIDEYDPGDSPSVFTDMLGLVDDKFHYPQLSPVQWEILTPCTETEKEDIRRELEEDFKGPNYTEPDAYFHVFCNDNAEELSQLFEQQVLKQTKGCGVPYGRFQVRVKHELVEEQPDSPLIIQIGTKSDGKVEVQAESPYPKIPLVWTLPNGSTYQLKGCVRREPGHVSAFIRDKDGGFVHFNDSRVVKMTAEEAHKFFNNHASMLIYIKVN